jgi:cobalt/nickel transport system permease protein
VALREKPALGMSARAWLAAYLVAIVAATFIHAPALLAALLAIALAAAGPSRWRLLRKTLWAVLAFNLTISAGYALRVFLGFWFVSRFDLPAALAGWPTATLVATLALGQIRSLERIVGDFRLAFASRSVTPPRLADRARHAGVQGIALLDKSMVAATESTLAMRSRGAFDD